MQQLSPSKTKLARTMVRPYTPVLDRFEEVYGRSFSKLKQLKINDDGTHDDLLLFDLYKRHTLFAWCSGFVQAVEEKTASSYMTYVNAELKVLDMYFRSLLSVIDPVEMKYVFRDKKMKWMYKSQRGKR